MYLRVSGISHISSMVNLCFLSSHFMKPPHLSQHKTFYSNNNRGIISHEPNKLNIRFIANAHVNLTNSCLHMLQAQWVHDLK